MRSAQPNSTAARERSTTFVCKFSIQHSCRVPQHSCSVLRRSTAVYNPLQSSTALQYLAKFDR
eukprot:10860531-Lingulodinium_polyedra.AAC.1